MAAAERLWHQHVDVLALQLSSAVPKHLEQWLSRVKAQGRGKTECMLWQPPCSSKRLSGQGPENLCQLLQLSLPTP